MVDLSRTIVIYKELIYFSHWLNIIWVKLESFIVNFVDVSLLHDIVGIKVVNSSLSRRLGKEVFLSSIKTT